MAEVRGEELCGGGVAVADFGKWDESRNAGCGEMLCSQRG